MKKYRSLVAIFAICLFVGSMSSCKAIKKSKSKRCKCPKWSSLEDQQPQKEIKDEVVVKYQDAD